jgi:hypothetical protein
MCKKYSILFNIFLAKPCCLIFLEADISQGISCTVIDQNVSYVDFIGIRINCTWNIIKYSHKNV